MDAQRLRDIMTQITEYERGGNEASMTRIEREIGENEEKKRKCLLAAGDIEQRIQAIQGKVGKTEDMVRRIKDNQRLRRLKVELGEFDRQIAKIYEEAGKLPSREDVEGEIKALEESLNKENAKKYFSAGNTTELQNMVKKCQADLKSPLYNEIDKRYRDELIKLKTTELSVSDLEKYMKAIDV